MRVAVVGGGITGLVAAYEAASRGASVVLYEAGPRLGGKLVTSDFCGRPVDEGPDAFLARVPHAVALCGELGLASELVAPVAGRAYVWTRGVLRPLPEGLVLGVPTDLLAVARSGILSVPGLVRAGLDVVLPRSRFGSDDPSVAEVVAARFGREASERLVEPLLGGIHAGRADGLSLASVAPQLSGAVARARSLLAGLRGTAPSLEGPVFLAPRGGMGALVSALAARLSSLGVEVRLDSPLTGLPDADRVVLAVPAKVAAGLVGGACGAAAAGLRAIDHASVVLVTLGYEGVSLPAGSGFLVPRVDGRLMTACSFGSQKWPHWSAGDGVSVLRVSAGRAGDDRALRMSDGEVVAALRTELAEALGPGLRAEPVDVRVSRWVDGFPQYAPGHAARVASIKAALTRDLPHVRIAGSPVDGVGIPACIASARQAAAP